MNEKSFKKGITLFGSMIAFTIIALFSIILLPSCATTDGGDNGGTDNFNGGLSGTTTTINPKVKGTWETSGETIVISDTAVVVTDKSNPSNTTSYEVVSSDGDKIVVKDPADPTKTIDIDYQLTNNESELSLTIDGTTYDTTKVAGATTTTTTVPPPTTTTTINPRLKGTWEGTNESVVITKTSIVVTDKGNPANNKTYEIVSADGDKFTVKDPDDATKTIDIDYLFKDYDTELALAIDDATHDVIKEIAMIYVSTTGNDDNDGTPESPVKSLSMGVLISNAKKNTIYIAKGDYSDLANIATIYPLDIRGGYSASWTRDSSDDKSKIEGKDATANYIGTITAMAGSKIALENLDIKGAKYNNQNAFGIVYGGDLSMDNCDIVGVDSGTISGGAYGIYNSSSSTSNLSISGATITGAAGTASVNITYAVNGSNLTINSGTITGAKDNTTVSWVYGASGSNLTINSGAVITGAAGSATVRWVYGVSSSGTSIISGGTITGAKDSAAVSNNIYGIYNGGSSSNITVENSSIITGVAGNVTTSSSANAYGISGSGTVTINGATVTGAAESTSVSSACGVSGSNLTINSGTITGAKDNTTVRWVYGVSNSGTSIISGGTITGAAESASVSSSAYAVSNNSESSLTIESGAIITGAKNSANVKSVYGINNYGSVTINNGTITAAAGSATISSTSYSSVYGINNGGTLTIKAGTIVGAKDNVSLSGSSADAYGIRNGASADDTATTTITGGTITLLAGSATISSTSYSTVYGLYNGGGSRSTSITNISGGTITVATGSAVCDTYGAIYGLYNNAGTNRTNSILTISGGTTTVAAGNAKVTSRSGSSGTVCGLYNNGSGDSSSNARTTISGGTITVAANSSVVSATTSGNIYGVRTYSGSNGGISSATVSNCNIYVRDTTTTTVTGTINVLYKDSNSKIYKGTGAAANIYAIKGSGTNLWTTGFTWDIP